MKKSVNQYPTTAEQYLIANYETAVRENNQLKMEKKVLENKLRFYEETEAKPIDPNSIHNKVKALPTLTTHYSHSIEYDYMGYNLTLDRVKEVKAYLERIKDDPKLTLERSKIGRISKHIANVKLSLFDCIKYALAYIDYNNNELEISILSTVTPFETAYDEYVERLELEIERWEEKQEKEGSE
jgi:hypothetical protein